MSTIKWPKRKKIFKLSLYLDWEAAAIGFLLAIATYVGPSIQSSTHDVSQKSCLRLVIAGILVIFAVAAGVSATYKAHLKRAYDPSLVLRFEKEFFSDMTEQRGKAAAVLLQYSDTGDWGKIPDAAEIEPILDFFDNLGFYLYGNQLSERVLHQSFCHWIALYYQEGSSYIRQRQKGEEGEKSTWEHIEYLVSEVFEIESVKQGCSREALRLSQKKYRKYLLEELEEGEEAFKTEFRDAHPELFKPRTLGA